MESSYEKFVFVIRFFTRLPIPGSAEHKGDLAENAVWFPLAGLVVGLITGLFWFCFSQILPGLVAAGLTICLGVLITGGLHEDGLADCADGLGGGFTRERALEIMKDSRIGAYGSMAIVFSIALRWTALASLGLWSGFAALVMAHTVSRAAIILPLTFSSYARSEGLGSTVAKGVPRPVLALALVITLLITVLLGWFSGLVAGLLAFAIAWLFMKRMDDRLGGYTGDTLGAIQQLSEITVLLTLASSLTA